MKDSSILKKVLFSSWFLASVPALVVSYFLLPVSSKYSLTIEKPLRVSKNLVYEDLNNDTISEIVYSEKGIPYYYICAKNSDLHIYDQWNLTDSLNPRLFGFFFGNYNHNQFEEIYAFTCKGDSLFLNVNEIVDPGGMRLERVFITRIGYLKGEVTSVLKPAGFFDENGDGRDELYFSISSGFRQGPRKMYAFNLVTRHVITSPNTAIICLDPKMVDTDGDNRPEIFGLMSASGNYNSNIPYSDSSTWFMVFNDHLEFEFPPVEFHGFANGLDINAFNDGNSWMYILTHSVKGTDPTVLKPQIMAYSPQGKLIRRRLLSDLGFMENVSTFVFKDNKSDGIYLVGDKVVKLNEMLEVICSVRLPAGSSVNTYHEDINNDGEDEILVYSENEGKLLVYSGGLVKMGEQSIKTPDPVWKFSKYLSKNHERKLFLNSGGSGYFLNLKKNNLYFLGFMAFPGIYIAFLLFILLIRKINTYQVQRKESLNRRLVTLQLQGIKSQLDPHFTFNTLNSVASLIYTEERQAAYDYMTKFTQLLRGMLNDAERIYRSVSEEIQFVTTYLDLEKLRFGDKFNYRIEIGDGVTQKEQVPKLVLQTFAENAINHGIVPSEKGGTLLIRIERQIENLRLMVEDNGIGRERAAGQSNSTGKGLSLTGEFYDILNQLNTKPIRYIITDLYDESGDPCGTRVEIWVPVDLNQDKS